MNRDTTLSRFVKEHLLIADPVLRLAVQNRTTPMGQRFLETLRPVWEVDEHGAYKVQRDGAGPSSSQPQRSATFAMPQASRAVGSAGLGSPTSRPLPTAARAATTLRGAGASSRAAVPGSRGVEPMELAEAVAVAKARIKESNVQAAKRRGSGASGSGKESKRTRAGVAVPEPLELHGWRDIRRPGRYGLRYMDGYPRWAPKVGGTGQFPVPNNNPFGHTDMPAAVKNSGVVVYPPKRSSGEAYNVGMVWQSLNPPLAIRAAWKDAKQKDVPITKAGFVYQTIPTDDASGRHEVPTWALDAEAWLLGQVYAKSKLVPYHMTDQEKELLKAGGAREFEQHLADLNISWEVATSSKPEHVAQLEEAVKLRFRHEWAACEQLRAGERETPTDADAAMMPDLAGVEPPALPVGGEAEAVEGAVAGQAAGSEGPAVGGTAAGTAGDTTRKMFW